MNGWNERTVTTNGASRPLVGITMGDPCGVGAEVIVKALSRADVRAWARYVVFGIRERFERAAAAAEIRPYWFCIRPGEPLRVDSGVIVVDFPIDGPTDWDTPRATAGGGAASLRFFDAAIECARNGAIDAIVTGPIHKTSWKLAGCPFPGHTEKIAAAFDTKRYNMMFSAPGLRVVLASTHIGYFELRNRFNIGLVFQPIELVHQALREWFGLAMPRIAVAGLNPHAGEGGLFGDEERRVIEPAMQMARNLGIHVDGPFPADTLFTPRNRARFDAIVAMYHDQGLIPVKALAFDRAVNLTIGLPVIRTSVDHGTAFDIAGKNIADEGSMVEAIRLAVSLATTNAERSCPNTPALTAT